METLLTFAGILGGLVLLVAGAEALVRGASSLATAAGVSALVIGLTVVAFGTSAPEFAVSVGGALTGTADVAVGNVVGSNVFNVLAVLGIAALFGDLVVRQRIVRVDVPFLLVVTGGVWWAASDGRLVVLEGLVLVAGLAAYTLVAFIVGRREPAEVIDQYEEAFGETQGRDRTGWARPAGLVVGGLVMLVIGARLLVDGVTGLAADLGVPDVVVGLTIVAIGTSLPELVTSVVAARRGELDIAVGNVVGSNLFNLLGVLGGAVVVGGGMDIHPSVVAGDLPIALVTTLVALPVLATGLVVQRWEGSLLLAGYSGYLAVVVLVGIGSAYAGWARGVLIVALLVVATVLVVAGLARARRAPV